MKTQLGRGIHDDGSHSQHQYIVSLSSTLQIQILDIGNIMWTMQMKIRSNKLVMFVQEVAVLPYANKGTRIYSTFVYNLIYMLFHCHCLSLQGALLLIIYNMLIICNMLMIIFTIMLMIWILDCGGGVRYRVRHYNYIPHLQHSPPRSDKSKV